jgi:hypothetical protein
MLTVHSIYIEEAMLYAREYCNGAVNKQVHIYNTRNYHECHKYVHHK